ncbi:hypothetical protein MRX96_033662 [Rhipicephalus microplus]
MKCALVMLPAIVVVFALWVSTAASNAPPMQLPQLPMVPVLPHKQLVKPDTQEVATSAVGGGLVPDWARPTTLLETIVHRIRGSRPCKSTDGIEEGTCLPKHSCSSTGGATLSSNDCHFTTVCCKLPEEVSSAVSCGGSIRSNNTAFRNPEFPGEFRQSGLCSAEVLFGREVCQLRLDFVHFSLAGPRVNGPRAGLCDDDVFTVATNLGSIPYPTLCGENAGQHMYIDVSEATRAVLSVNIGGEAPQGRKWHIRVSFIHCLSPQKAPASCLQYFPEPQGEFNSFNYIPGAPKQQLIAGLKYSICFRRQLGLCQINFTPATTNELFQMGNGIGPLTGARNCEDAYLFVPSGSNRALLEDTTSDRFCGNGFPGGSVSSDVQPFAVSVVTSKPRGSTSGVGAGFATRSFDGGVAVSHDGRHGSHQPPVISHPSLAMYQQMYQQMLQQLQAYKPSPGSQIGFVKDQFSVIKHSPHNLQHFQNTPFLHPQTSLITVVERPDPASGPGVQEQPQPVDAIEASNSHVGGFRLRYSMSHCNM